MFSKTRNVRDLHRNIEALSNNRCCGGKAINITYSECVSVALVIEYAKRMLHIVMWPVWVYHIFPNYLINFKIFGKTLLKIKCMF